MFKTNQLAGFFFCLFQCFALFTVPPQAIANDETTASTNSAKTSFQEIRPMLYQLRTSSGKDSSKSSYGTAFVVGMDGLLATNYHVVASSIWSKKNEKLFLVDGTTLLPALVVRVDVKNDLALIRVDKRFHRTLRMTSPKISQGERVFSLGLPLDLDWTVTEGTYNGIIKKSIFEQIHLTTSINSGMSGGPTVNSHSELVGVNVSRYVSGSQVSFAVPWAYLNALIKRNRAGRGLATIDQIQKSIGDQISEAQDQIAEELLFDLGQSKNLGGWKIPKFRQSTECWSQTKSGPMEPIEYISETCSLAHNIYLDSDTKTSSFQFDQTLIKNIDLNFFKFHHAVNETWNGKNNYDHSFFQKDNALNKGPTDCIFSPISKVDSKGSAYKVQVEVCLQPLIPYTTLFDSTVKVSRLANKYQAFVSRIDLEGFSKSNIQKIATKLVEILGEESHD